MLRSVIPLVSALTAWLRFSARYESGPQAPALVTKARLKKQLEDAGKTFASPALRSTSLALIGLRLLFRIFKPLRLHLLVLAIVWAATQTSQFSSLLSDEYGHLRTTFWQLKVFVLFLVILATGFRITAFTRNTNAPTFAAVTLLGCGFSISLPGCQINALVIVTLVIVVHIVVISNFTFGWNTYADLVTPGRGTCKWYWRDDDRWIVPLLPFMPLARLASIRVPPLLSALLFCVFPILGLFYLSDSRVAKEIEVPSLLLLEAGLWLLILTEVQTWSRRLRLPVVTILMIFGIFLSATKWNYHHEVRTLEMRDTAVKTGTEDVKAIFSKWLLTRKDRDRYAGRPYPVVLVAAEGGGIRAAYITAEFLTLLQHVDSSFKDHLFAISGVSGGAVGAVVFAGECELAERQDFNGEIPQQVLVDQNFLSGPVAALLGPEVLQRIIPSSLLRPLRFRGIDRATSLEQAFEDAFEQVTNSPAMKADFCTDYDPSGAVPLLFLNATDASTGRRVVLTPVRIASDADAVYPVQEKRSIHLARSTAAFLSARFPFVSPAAEMVLSDRRTISVVDGGYVDNTGTETLAALIAEISKVTTNESCSFIILLPTFAEQTLQEATGIPGNFETLPVIDAILKSRSRLSSSSEKLSRLVQSLRASFTCELIKVPIEGFSQIPLGWCLSDDSRISLDDAMLDELPSSGPVDPFPPVELNLLQEYQKTLRIEEEHFQHTSPGDYDSFYSSEWPIFEDPKWSPEIASMLVADFPPFMSSWCGVAMQTQKDPVSLKDATIVLHHLRQARSQVLEIQTTRLTNYDAFNWFAGLGGFNPLFSANRNSRLSILKFDDEYQSYLHHAAAVTAGTSVAAKMDGWVAVLDRRCKDRWESAKASYMMALTVLNRSNVPDAQEAKAAIERELRQLEEMYARRWPANK